MVFMTRSEADTMEFAGRLAPMLSPGDTVLLNGDLGAGKSVFARGIAGAMGVRGPMPSPTFTLLQPYEGKDGRKVYHFDLYRLSDPDEYYAAGLDEYVGGDGVALVEWPQNADLSACPALVVTLERTDCDECRRIEIENNGVSGYDAARLEGWRAEV